jgi:hypothetical protein
VLTMHVNHRSSGVISINRNTIARYFADQMLEQARKSCILPWTGVKAEDVVGTVSWKWSFTPGKKPSVSTVSASNLVAMIQYSKEARSQDKNLATYGELNTTSSYACGIIFGRYGFEDQPAGNNNEITIVQNLKISVYCQWSATASSADIVDITLSDLYVVSVADGSLSSTLVKSTKTDRSQSGDRSAFVNFFTGVNDMIDNVKDHSKEFVNSSIKSLRFDDIKQFVFPGGRVFAYKSAQFSDNQDLVALITYVSPTVNQSNISMMNIPKAMLMPGKPEVIELDELPPAAIFIKESKARGIVD